MSIKDLTDEQIKSFVENPEDFLSDKANMEAVLGFDSSAKRKFSDIMRYEMGLSDKAIEEKLNLAAGLKLKDVDVFTSMA